MLALFGAACQARRVADLHPVLADLAAEGEELDAAIAALPATDWNRPTPAVDWTIAHQIAHLAWTDRLGLLAISDPATFRAQLDRALPRIATLVDDAAADGAHQRPAALLSGWRAGRSALHAALATVPDGTKLPWFGPPMNAMSMATGRLMETWAHGQDVADALAITRTPTQRLRHVAHLGVRTRDFAYLANGRRAPATAFRIELTAPAGEQWTWGPADAEQRVVGPALDFCLLVTQRRHRDDTALRAEGEQADEWLGIAQAFAGPPGAGRPRGAAT
jgi:uncharacterized protein (TIGR03084 family)